VTKYWLMKSEPDVYSIDTLESEGKTHWEGVRNYQARNFMRDEMSIGDQVLFYHSNTKPPGVVGLAEVCSEPYPDFTAWDKKSPYFDPKTDPESPRWMMVDVAYKETFKRLVTLDELKEHPDLEEMLVIRRGMRLSVQPVDKDHFDTVLRLGKQ